MLFLGIFTYMVRLKSHKDFVEFTMVIVIDVLGLGLIYQAVKEEDRQEVVELLVDRLTTGKRKKIAFADDSEVFAEGTLGASPDG